MAGELEEEDDESEYGVRGSRRKTKSTRKARGAARSSAPRGSKKGGAGISISKPGARGKSANARGRKKATNEDDDEFINDGEEGVDAGDDLDHDDDDDDQEDDEVDKTDKKGGEETVFIDNLPNDEFEIRNMLKDVRKHIKKLERDFFEEEDSEKEEELK